VQVKLESVSNIFDSQRHEKKTYWAKNMTSHPLAKMFDIQQGIITSTEGFLQGGDR
jgi:hypothetical protein